MATSVTSLHFITEDRSLWHNGQAISFSIDSGDFLIYDPDEITYDFDVDIGVAGASAQAYLDFKIGLLAYADLGSAGGFDAAYNLLVNVDHPTAINALTTNNFNVDFSDYQIVNATIDSEAFGAGAGAGLDVVLGANFGIRNLEWFAFGFSGDVDDLNFVDIDKRIPIIEITPTMELEVELTEGLNLIGRLPTGAETHGLSVGSTTVTSSGFSDTKFVELDADLDELLMRLIEKIPGVGQVLSGVGEFLFAEHEFDLHDYISAVPAEKIKLAITAVDIGASAGLVVTEDLGLDIGNGTNVPDVDIVLRSDNGTPLDFSDDVIQAGKLGGVLNVPTATAIGSDRVATQQLTAYYDLASVDYNHAVGIGVNTSITIDILQGELRGSWVPSALSFSFGPLFSAEFPDGGFQFKLGDIYTDEFALDTGGFTNAQNGADPATWNYQAGAFNQVTDTYDVFVTDAPPPGWDPEAPNAMQVLYTYIEAKQQNLAASVNAFGDLWNNAGSQTNRFLVAGEAYGPGSPGYNSANMSLHWDGIGDGVSVNAPREFANNNFTLIDLSNAAANAGRSDTFLAVDIAPDATPFNDADDNTNPFSTNPIASPQGVKYDSSIQEKADLLDNMDDAAYARYIHWTNNASFQKIFLSVLTPNVIGTDNGDVIVHFGSDGLPRLYDGAAESRSIFDDDFAAQFKLGHDTFVGNFLSSNPNDAINFDGRDANFNTDGVTIAGNVTIKGFESFVLRTGNADDFVTDGPWDDWFETSAGMDLITLNLDSKTDHVFAGADDDVIFGDYSISESFYNTNAQQDRFFGGTGDDLGVFRAEENYDSFGDVIGSNRGFQWPTSLRIYVDGASGDANDPDYFVNHLSPVDEMFAVLDRHNGGIYNQALGVPIDLWDSAAFEADGSRDYFQYVQEFNVGGGFTVFPTASFYADVDRVSVLGANRGQDIALFNGGYEYFGGDGVYETDDGMGNTIPDLAPDGQPVTYLDTLLADFGGHAARLGVTNGVVLVAEDRIGHTGPEQALSFGESLIKGWERIIATGTQYNDYFLGGRYNDGFDGGAGNDVIDGGEFETFYGQPVQGNYELIETNVDQLSGGAGDDTFYWSDDGADRIDGGSDTRGDWLFVTAEADSAGLEYGFFRDGHAYLNGVDKSPSLAIERDIILNAQSASTDILAGLARLGGGTAHDGDANPQTSFDFGTGIRFGDTLGENIVSSTPFVVDRFMDFQDIEHVNVTGTDAHSDLVYYQGGATYLGGETAGDMDVFAADFSGSSFAIDLEFGDANNNGTFLGNGTLVGGFERGIVKAGSAHDHLVGGDFHDIFYGGAGNDTLFAGMGGGRLFGEDGNDLVFWGGEAEVFAYGGDGDDHLIIGGNNAGLSYFFQDAGGMNLSGGIIGSGTSLSNLNAALANLPAAAEFQIFTNGQRIIYGEFEHVSIAGTDAVDDLVIYQSGLVSIGGERVGDADIFAGNLSNETADLTLVASDRGDMSQIPGTGSDVFDPQSGQFTGDSGELRDIGNGNLVGGFERFNVQLGSGDDVAVGGLLQDTIRGGDGDDKLDSGTGGSMAERDYLNGDGGDDILTFTGGFAEFDGGAGDNDQLDFLIHTDALSYSIIDGGGNVIGSPFTAATNDRTAFGTFFSNNPFFSTGQYDFSGGSLRLSNMEHTAMEGSSQGDFLFSTLRSGALFGGDGDDVIVSSLGLDNMLGGAGFDTYAFKSGFGRDTIARETVNGGRIYFEDLQQSDVTFFVSNGVDLHVMDPTFSQVIIRDYFAEGGNGLDFTFDFTDFTGSIDLSGLAGIVPTGAPVFGVTETGTANDDEFLTQFSENKDTYYGLEGDDYFAGSRGADLFVGGPGSDTVSYYERGLGPVSVNLINREGTQGNADRDILIGIENLIGTAFDDSLLGDEIANTILGGAGNDTLRGFRGDDLLIGNEGDDTIEGAQGEDDLFGDDGTDTLSGGDDADYLAGGDGDDTLSGDGGDDILAGGAGNDTASGGDGDDTFLYGLGDDPATDPLADPANNEAGVDSFDPGAGNDTADFSNFGFAITVYLDSLPDEAFTEFTDTASPSNVLNGLGNMDGVENVVGTDFADVFWLQNPDVAGYGGFGDDLFMGLNGSQTFVGGGDFDTLDYSSEGGGGGIIVDLFTGPNRVVTDTFGDTDTVAEIEKFIGTSMGDQFIGDDLSTTFDSMGGFDAFSGKGGNDTFIATPDGANAILNGGDGFDTLDYSVFTQNVVFDVIGNEVRDNGGATVGSDNIVGFERFISGIGNDHGLGGAASEEFDLGTGNDFVAAGDGDDTVIAGEGTDTYDGGAGIDLIDYSRFAQGVSVFLNSGIAIEPSAVQDTVVNFENVVGSLGSDLLRGDGGDNIFYYRAEAGQGGTDQINGDGGFDIFDLSGFGAAVVLDWEAAVEVQTRDGATTLPSEGALRNVGALTNVEQVIVTDFADELRGTVGDDRLEGRNGDDILVGRDGEDELRGDSGSDTVDYSQDGGTHGVLLDFAGVVNGTPFWRDSYNENDTLVSVENAIGTDFNDVIIGDNNNNVLDGRAGIDLIYGFAGQNLLYGGDGNDDLQGGTDKDTIYGQNDDDDIQGHEGNDVLSGGAGDDTLDGGDGLDVADYRDSLSAVTVNLNHTVISTTGGLGSDTFISIEGAIGGDFNDKFFGKDNDNYFEGGAGADTFSTFGGVDVVIGGDGNDRAFMGLGNDTASGGEGADNLNGQEDNDVLSGDAGNDRLYGGTGDDILKGGAGADLLVGNAGSDTMDGGDGNDRLYVDGDDTPSNVSGGAGSDRLIGLGSGDLTYVMHAHSLEGALGAAGNDTFDGSRLQQRTVMVGKDGNDILFGGVGNDLLEGRNDDDHLRGNDGTDFLTGQNGADLLEGGEGDDTLFGGNQDDELRGDAGNDRLQGDAGSDTLAGGAGDDDVRVDSSDLQANITGGNGFDTLRLLGTDAYDFAFGAQGFERAYGNSAANELDGSAATQGVTIYGLNGDDVLTGSMFNDSIIAGNDDDIVMLLAGADSAHGGNGTDRAIFAGNQADYSINIVSAGVSAKITHLASGDVNSLSFFEFAQFDDGTIAI